MAQISLPTLQPVDQPTVDVRQVARPGAVASQLNEEAEAIASRGLQVEGHLIDAQRQLDVKSGENAIGKLQVQLYDDLRKSVTSEEVDKALEHYRQQVPNALSPFGKDPKAAHVLQQYADSEDNRIQDYGNVQKADIITKNDNAANTVLGETYKNEGITERLAGGDGRAAEGKYIEALGSSVRHGTLMPEVAAEKVQAWRKNVQVGAIEARINDPNPMARQALINELKAGKGPLVDGLPDAMRNQMITAAESRNRELTNLAESQDVNSKFNNSLGQFQAHPTLYSSPEARSAAFGNPEFLKSVGAVTADGQPDFVAGEKLRKLYEPLGADEKTAMKVKADKEFDDVIKLIDSPVSKLGEARQMLDKYQKDFDAVDVNYYRAGLAAIQSEVKYNEGQVRFSQEEARASRTESRLEAQQKGKQSFAELMQKVSSGQSLDFQTDIAPLLISGDITTGQVRSAMAMQTLAQKDEGVKQGLIRIQKSPQFSAVTDVTNKDMGDLQFAYTNMVHQHNLKGQAAIDLADKMVDESSKKNVQAAIADAFKPVQPDEGWTARIGKFFSRPPASTGGPIAATAQPQADYDMAGYDKEHGAGEGEKTIASGQHLPDTYKLPNHITFSKDSKYSNSGQEGGTWKQDGDKWNFTPSAFNLSQHTIQEYMHYFDTVEKDSVLRVSKNGRKYDYVGNDQWRATSK